MNRYFPYPTKAFGTEELQRMLTVLRVELPKIKPLPVRLATV